MNDIVVSASDGVGTVRLNRPERGNSVTPDVVTRLGRAVADLAETDGICAVVLTGTGTVFCAGADVRDMYAVYTTDGPDALMDYLAATWMPAVQRTVRLLWNTPVPIIAAYNGAATAGGLDFGLACDLRIAASSARFAESYVNLGMVPVAGGAYFLPTIVGSARALQLMGSGSFIPAATALEWGMVSEVCEVADLMDRAHELARQMTHGPARTYTQAKQLTRMFARRQLDEALDASLAANIELIGHADVRERILRVMERHRVTS